MDKNNKIKRAMSALLDSLNEFRLATKEEGIGEQLSDITIELPIYMYCALELGLPHRIYQKSNSPFKCFKETTIMGITFKVKDY